MSIPVIFTDSLIVMALENSCRIDGLEHGIFYLYRRLRPRSQLSESLSICVL
jgi:hypothetical protein